MRGQRALQADNIDCSQYKCVALTFDDGPTPFTDRLLQVLTDQGAKATFFLIGNKVAADPDAARQLTTTAVPLPIADLDQAELAAWTVVANVLFNLDEFVTRG
jgi:peptidoglycan/xylan/chitin deacetylase (PgdA/CDA1 family)